MTCREEVLKAAHLLTRRSTDGSFSPQDVVAELRRRGSRYAGATIKTHVVSRMCVNAPANHASCSDELERVGPARYRLR